MVRRLMIAGLVAAGLLFVAIGVQKWFDARSAAAVVDALMQAIVTGDREAALALLDPERRQLVEARTDPETEQALVPQTGVTYRIGTIDIDGDRAACALSVEKEGFIIRPVVHLRRGETRHWKIDRIEHLEVDPRWLKLWRAQQRREGEQLADELGRALENRPGVSVERVAIQPEAGSPDSASTGFQSRQTR